MEIPEELLRLCSWAALLLSPPLAVSVFFNRAARMSSNALKHQRGVVHWQFSQMKGCVCCQQKPAWKIRGILEKDRLLSKAYERNADILGLGVF